MSRHSDNSDKPVRELTPFRLAIQKAMTRYSREQTIAALKETFSLSDDDAKKTVDAVVSYYLSDQKWFVVMTLARLEALYQSALGADTKEGFQIDRQKALTIEQYKIFRDFDAGKFKGDTPIFELEEGSAGSPKAHHTDIHFEHDGDEDENAVPPWIKS